MLPKMKENNKKCGVWPQTSNEKQKKRTTYKVVRDNVKKHNLGIRH